MDNTIIINLPERSEINAIVKEELLEYQFPEHGSELITEQYARYNNILNQTHHFQNALLPNENVFQSKFSGFNYLLRIDEDCNDQVFYKISKEGVFSTKDKQRFLQSDQNILISIFHHNDLDGITAAAIVNKGIHLLEDNNKILNFVEYNYSNGTLISQCNNSYLAEYAKKYKIAIIVDLQLTSANMQQIGKSYDKIIYIDHHERSIEVLKNLKISPKVELECLIDTRYSATYLTYLLFQKNIEEIHHKKPNKLLPIIVSIYDTKAFIKDAPNWVPIQLTSEIIKNNIGREYRTTVAGKIFHIEKDMQPGIVYMRPTLNGSDTRFRIIYYYGLCCQQYFSDMGCIEPWSTLYDAVLFETKKVQEFIDIGATLREIMRVKAEYTYQHETRYIASIYNMRTKGMMTNSHARFGADPNSEKYVRLKMKYKNQNTIKVSIFTEDPYVKQIGIPNIVKKYFYEIGGHRGAATVTIELDNSMAEFQTRLNKYPKFKSFFEKIKWVVESENKQDIRYDKKAFETFKILSTYILYEQYTNIQSNV